MQSAVSQVLLFIQLMSPVSQVSLNYFYSVLLHSCDVVLHFTASVSQVFYFYSVYSLACLARATWSGPVVEGRPGATGIGATKMSSISHGMAVAVLVATIRGAKAMVGRLVGTIRSGMAVTVWWMAVIG